MNKNLAKISDLLDMKTAMSESDHAYLLILIRRELEFFSAASGKDGKAIMREKYGDLELFCDWALHWEINRSAAGSNLVSEIHTVVTNDKDTIQIASKTLLSTFKAQFKMFLNTNALKTTIIDIENEWKYFLSHLFEIIEQTPIFISVNDEIIVKNTPLEKDNWAIEISITKNTRYNIQIKTNTGILIEIPITLV